MKGGVRSAVCRTYVALLLALPTAYAAMANPETGATPDERAALVTLLQSAEVSRRLEVMGHNPRLVRQRVAAMSDLEVRALAGRLTALAGASEDRLGAFAAALVLSTAFGGTR